MKHIALIGMPNTGKSTFFNRLTGANASIGNWPGITVDLMVSKITLGQQQVQVVDLPGIYDLRGYSEDEAVVRKFLETTPLDLILMILNATQLDRQLSLALQIKHLNLESILLLNMIDEVSNFGVSLQTDQIAQQLGIPVVPISAKYGSGYDRAYQTIMEHLNNPTETKIIGSIEQQLLPENELATSISEILQNAVQVSDQPKETLTTKLDKILLHPIVGLPIFFIAMFLMFQIVYAIGTPLQELLGESLTWIRDNALEPITSPLPKFAHNFLLDGLYEGLGTVLAFVPVILLFFICMAIVEDSGYLSRSAFLMDALMERLGLDGRSFVMSLMGFGCNVPAIMGTRVMRSPGLRLLSMLVIPFSLCSARLNVFIFITTALFSPKTAPLVLFSLYLLTFVAAILTAAIFKNNFPNQDPFVLELPPYRFPTIKQMILRAWHETKHFFIWSRQFIILGVVAIWLLNNLPPDVPPASAKTLSGMLGNFTQPILAPIGINPQLAVALLFGFIAKEIVLGGLAVIYGIQSGEDQALMNAISAQVGWVEAYSFMLFTLLYVPCLSTIAVIKTESKSYKFATLTVLWSVGLAWVASFIFYQGAKAIGF